MRAILAALLIVLAPTSAFAWGQTGHRVTGAIAEPMLSRRAAREVRAILGSETLAEASTWADDMRSDSDAFWQTTANPWHYVTVPVGRSYAEVGAPGEGDAVTRLHGLQKRWAIPMRAAKKNSWRCASPYTSSVTFISPFTPATARTAAATTSVSRFSASLRTFTRFGIQA